MQPLQHRHAAAHPHLLGANGQLVYSLPSITRNYEGLGKLDYTSGRHQMMFSAFFVNYTSAGWNGNGTLLNYGLNQTQTTSEGKVSDTFTISPRLVNSFVVDILVLNSSRTTAAPFSIFDFGNDERGGAGREIPRNRHHRHRIFRVGHRPLLSSGQVVPGGCGCVRLLSFTHGGHSFAFGVEYEPYLRFDSATGYQQEPLYNFTGFATVRLRRFPTRRCSEISADRRQGQVTRGPQFAAFAQDDGGSVRGSL